MFSKTSKHYPYLQEVLEHLKEKGKYVATKENTFDVILDTLEGTEEQKLLTIRYFTEFSHIAIASLEKDENDRHTFVFFGGKYVMFQKYKSSRTEGVIYVAKDC
ncbi:MAG: hypothetical protein WC875_01820 [Candidatus Absconditabacterales bacterium]